MYSRFDLPSYVRKKTHHVQKFDPYKIESSLFRTLKHVGKESHLARKLTKEVCYEISNHPKDMIEVDKIRKAIINVLKKNKLRDVIEAYDFVFLHIKNLGLKKVVKRDGRTEAFDPYKIFKSIRKSFTQADIQDGKRCEDITKEVVKILEKKYKGKSVPVENIKEDVEYVLVRHKLPQVAKFYILHRYM